MRCRSLRRWIAVPHYDHLGYFQETTRHSHLRRSSLAVLLKEKAYLASARVDEHVDWKIGDKCERSRAPRRVLRNVDILDDSLRLGISQRRGLKYCNILLKDMSYSAWSSSHTNRYTLCVRT